MKVSTGNLIGRLHGYLIERFSLYAVLVLGAAHVYFLQKVTGGLSQPSLFAAAFTLYIGFFMGLRFLDDSKDKQHDDTYYNDRPVQRGTISLDELRTSFWVVMLILFLAVLLVGNASVLGLFALCCLYLYFMYREFFVREYLRERLLLYLASHQVFSFILSGLIVQVFGLSPFSPHGFWLVLASALMILSVEVARKMRIPAEESGGNDTYSAVLGRSGSVVFWLASLVVVITILAIKQIIPAASLAVMVLPIAASSYYLRVLPKKSETLFVAVTAIVLLTVIGIAVW